MKSSLDKIIDYINKEKPYFIGISGIVGSGKSTLANILQNKLENSIIVQMDGYHIKRKNLD